jgi:hypothetical protein
MKLIQKIISAGFATCALASASLPALSWTVWPDVDFEWYANVGKPVAGATATIETFPAPREGQIWSPSHYERSASGAHVYVPGRWVADDYSQQVATYGTINAGSTVATGPLTLRDRDGNAIPTSPNAYPVDSARR